MDNFERKMEKLKELDFKEVGLITLNNEVLEFKIFDTNFKRKIGVVYAFVILEESRLLYIGVTSENLGRRFNKHANSKLGNKVKDIIMMNYKIRIYAGMDYETITYRGKYKLDVFCALEEFLIKELKPELNIKSVYY